MTTKTPAAADTGATDPIFLEVFWTRVRSIADEAAKLIVRTSFSTLSSEANDFAVVVTDSQGRSLAENSGSIPSFIGTLPRTVRAVLDQVGAGAMEPGDVFITNNPWIGTGHLNDVCLVKPIFHQARLVGFAATAGHVPDIGGKIRSVDARELFEEGFHIPVMRLLRNGRPDESLLTLIRTNVRTPEQTVGDIWSQVGAVELIATRLGEVLGEYGLAGIDDLAAALFDRSEAAMREAIRKIPEGEYRYEMETDGFDQRLRFVVAVRVADGRVECDFTGTSGQQPRAINCVLAYTSAMTVYAIKCLLLPELSNNDGLFRPIVAIAPAGTILNPNSPAPVGGRACTGHYVPVAIFGALASVLPDRVMAGAGSPLWIANLSGTRSNGKPFATVLFYNGGLGATAGKDGSSAMSWPSNISPTPIEVAERDSPLFFRYKRLRPGSGGAGRFRGGLGEEICFVNRHETPVSIVFLTERIRVPAPGLAGGGHGACGEVLVNGVAIDSRRPHVLAPNDEVILRTPGGGGYGPLAERDENLVSADRLHGYAR
ncbi:hydantoinase B/oxoprolinase family protein [Ramlibacter sp. Leaf400]|uniref:hydantoinase B/oxoprolinase family protein n=1 Tax=Ramlibacter sp. Leaf400 TaxID=1736365 RepID=UPI0006F852D6|nr:hydantoinase B/oxoprolinase family protein [Ramlibacter sp. Leaf400]KQT14033.1 hydantoinase [Ramlibacter sp. Leaf400]